MIKQVQFHSIEAKFIAVLELQKGVPLKKKITIFKSLLGQTILFLGKTHAVLIVNSKEI